MREEKREGHLPVEKPPLLQFSEGGGGANAGGEGAGGEGCSACSIRR